PDSHPARPFILIQIIADNPGSLDNSLRITAVFFLDIFLFRHRLASPFLVHFRSGPFCRGGGGGGVVLLWCPLAASARAPPGRRCPALMGPAWPPGLARRGTRAREVGKEPHDAAPGTHLFCSQRRGGGARSDRAVSTNHKVRPSTSAGAAGVPGTRTSATRD